ncbi:MAG: GYDIA family GHMP kinase [Bacteroidia bacterium]
MSTQFFAHGKLMLTGEYFVLDGATSLAFPTKKGQSLEFKVSSLEFKVEWRSFDHLGNVWFETEIDCKTLKSSNQNKVGQKLEQILRKARELNPEFLREGGEVEVKSDFNLKWGFGSSSTLVSLIAQWASNVSNLGSFPAGEVRRGLVDPYQIQFECFGGSGYDIACATAKSPILYQKWPEPKSSAITIDYPFKKHLYFVYLGQKQDSREGIKHYRAMANERKAEVIKELNAITNAVVQLGIKSKTAIESSKVLPPRAKLEGGKKNDEFGQFCDLLKRHEEIVGKAIDTKPVQERLFSDFEGQTKSLGAWGGDFILAASSNEESKVFEYFKSKGFGTILKFNETVC